MASFNSSSQPNACENLTIQGLIETISNLHNILSEAKLFFPAASIQENHKNVNQGDNKEKDGGVSSKRDLGNCFQSSLPARLRDKSRKEKSRNKEEKNDKERSTNSSNNHKSDCFQEINPREKLCNDLNYMKSALTKLKVFEDDLGKPIETLKCSIENILQTQESNGSIQTEQIQPKLREIRKELFNLKIKISSLHIISSTKSDANRYLPKSIGSNPYNATDDLPYLHKGNQFRQSSFFKEFQVMFENLDIRLRLCLLCFAVFPEDAVIKKRLLVHWWIGERLLDPYTSEDQTVKDAHKILEALMMKGFIKPVNRKYREIANSFKMHTFVRSAVIMLAKEAGFFDYNPEGNPTSNFFSCNRACLVNAQWLETEKLDKLKSENLDKLKTLFNVSNQFPDFTLEWFSKMRHLRVLYLGRWQSSGKNRHIEVESTEFLKGLKYMEDLRLLSLHGISGIRELPSYISKLRSLRILDLRACYNLENLPKQVGSLKMLTNLDISECYLLDYMPKELLSLSELQVLKGFVITDAKHGSFCTLADLAGLKKLQKLSINVNSEAFSLEELSITLRKFEELLKLKVAWGGESLQAKPDKNSKEVRGEARNKGDEGDIKKKEKSAVKSTNQEKNTEGQDDGATRPNRADDSENNKKPKGGPAKAGIIKRSKTMLKRSTTFEQANQGFPYKLQKLDLQCFPQETLPSSLSPENMKHLQKLYIRGGRLNILGKVEEGHENWAVEVLRFKYLNELKVSWRELQEEFPHLKYFEKFKCPKVTFCPCDSSGVWLR